MSRDAMPEMRSEQPRKGCIWVRRYDSLGMERYLSCLMAEEMGEARGNDDCRLVLSPESVSSEE